MVHPAGGATRPVAWSSLTSGAIGTLASHHTIATTCAPATSSRIVLAGNDRNVPAGSATIASPRAGTYAVVAPRPSRASTAPNPSVAAVYAAWIESPGRTRSPETTGAIRSRGPAASITCGPLPPFVRVASPAGGRRTPTSAAAATAIAPPALTTRGHLGARRGSAGATVAH